jgi:PAS domain-containing protein
VVIEMINLHSRKNKKTTEDLRISDAALLLAIIDQLPIALWVRNNKSEIILSNMKHVEMTGVSEQEMIGATMERLLGKERALAAR